MEVEGGSGEFIYLFGGDNKVPCFSGGIIKREQRGAKEKDKGKGEGVTLNIPRLRINVCGTKNIGKMCEEHLNNW